METELEGKTIVLKPKLVMDRDDAVKALHQIMSDVQSRNKYIDPETLEEGNSRSHSGSARAKNP